MPPAQPDYILHCHFRSSEDRIDGGIVDADDIFDIVIIRPYFFEAATTSTSSVPTELEPTARKCRSVHEQQSVSSMSTVAHSASIALLSFALLGASLAPAYALRMPESEDTYPTGQAVSAYARGEQTDPSTTSVLSAGEIRHVTWCAARYTLKYDAISDTYAGIGGMRLPCRSPR